MGLGFSRRRNREGVCFGNGRQKLECIGILFGHHFELFTLYFDCQEICRIRGGGKWENGIGTPTFVVSIAQKHLPPPELLGRSPGLKGIGQIALLTKFRQHSGGSAIHLKTTKPKQIPVDCQFKIQVHPFWPTITDRWIDRLIEIEYFFPLSPLLSDSEYIFIFWIAFQYHRSLYFILLSHFIF